MLNERITITIFFSRTSCVLEPRRKKEVRRVEKQLKDFLILEISGSEFVGPPLRPLYPEKESLLTIF
jgi:hypothetical protein